MKLGFLTAAFPDLSLEQVAAWAKAEGFETLEVACWPAGGGEKRRYAGVTHIDVDDFDAGEVRGRARPARARDLVARVLPQQPPPRRRPPRRGERPPAQGDRRRGQRSASTPSAPSSATTRTGRCPRTSSRFRAIWPELVQHAGSAGRADRDRELPDDLQLRRVARREQPRLVARDLGADVRRDPGRELRAQPRPLAPGLAA